MTDKKPIVLMTHELPSEWISKLYDHCQLYIGPTDATELDSSLIEMLPHAEGLFTLLTIKVNAALLAQAPKLRVISNMAVGIDNIDIHACTRRSIPVGNTPGVLTDSTADLTMALVLSMARNIPQASQDARLGKWKTWSPAGWLGMELNGATLGIVGLGKIGKAVAKRANGFGMNIIFTDTDHKEVPYGSQVPLETLLQISDIVTLHAPLSKSTRGLVNAKTLSLMKPTSILINAARGPLVDMDALVNALENHIIAGAALDVTEPEPLPPSHALFGLSNCLIVPHIGSATRTTRMKMAEVACENLIAGLHGKQLPFCVNPEVYIKTKWSTNDQT